MTQLNAGQSAALSANHIKPVHFAYLDFLGDPVRANTSGADITPTSTGDADLDGHTFIGITARLVDVSPVKIREGGSESVTARLSGIQGIDDSDLTMLTDRANWQGRDARLWRIVRDKYNVLQGGFHPFYTGKITSLLHSDNDEGQTLQVTIESYLAVFSQASNRSYLDQSRFDPGDQSAEAAIAIANGDYGGAAGGASTGGGGNRGGGPENDPRNRFAR